MSDMGKRNPPFNGSEHEGGEESSLHIRRCCCVGRVDRSHRQQKGKVAGQNRQEEVSLDSKYGHPEAHPGTQPGTLGKEAEKLLVKVDKVGIPASTSK